MKRAAIMIAVVLAVAWAAYITQKIQNIERMTIAACAYAHSHETGIITGQAGSDKILCPQTSD